MPDPLNPRNTLEAFFNNVLIVLQTPARWVREKVVEPNQQSYPWYHQKYRRVPTIDECYTDDVACIYEAEQQYKRDKMVDTQILNILRDRFEYCMMYEGPDSAEKCTPLWRVYEEATANWFAKYGDLGAYHNVQRAFMKQKHRMIWERRHGPVGSGMKPKEVEESE